MQQKLQEAYREYSRYLFDGGTRIILVPPDRSEVTTTKVYASNLGMCPLAAVLKREQAPMLYPPTEDEETSSFHYMNVGIRLGELLQEAMVWKYRAGYEITVENDVVKGRMDLLMDDFILEIKTGAPFGQASKPTPKLSHGYQLLVYGLITGHEDMAIIMINRHHFNGVPFEVWSLVPDGDGFVFISSNGTRCDEAFNTPETLNFRAVEAEIERQRRYLAHEVSDDPMPDYINADGGWQCFRWVKKPKTYKTEGNAKRYAGDEYIPGGPDGFYVPGLCKPRCEWFCHAKADDEVTVYLTEDGTRTMNNGAF